MEIASLRTDDELPRPGAKTASSSSSNWPPWSSRECSATRSSRPRRRGSWAA